MATTVPSGSAVTLVFLVRKAHKFSFVVTWHGRGRRFEPVQVYQSPPWAISLVTFAIVALKMFLP